MSDYLYVRQCTPELQNDPTRNGSFDDEFHEITACGNPRRQSHQTDEFSKYIELDNKISTTGIADNVTEESAQYLLKNVFRHYTTGLHPVWTIEKVLQFLHNRAEAAKTLSSFSLENLSMYAGREYEINIITEPCTSVDKQGDWQTIYYPAGLSDKTIERFRNRYFGVGTMWTINTTTFDPEKPEDIVGPIMQCLTDDPRGEIANAYNFTRDEIIMYHAVPATAYRYVPDDKNPANV